MAANVQIRDFIGQNFFAASGIEFTDDASLLDLGIIDSTGVLELVSFIESEFNIAISDSEIIPENLDSISNVCAFIAKKQAS
jgi:acyl carrier protein